MTANPLLDRRGATQLGRVTPDMLEMLADELNGMSWVRRKGWHYFVRSVDGRSMLDRSDSRQ